MKRLSTIFTLLFLLAFASLAYAGAIIGSGGVEGGGTEVDWDLLNEDFNDYNATTGLPDGWTDCSTGDACATVVTSGQLTLDSNLSAADNRMACLYQDIGDMPDEFTLWVDVSHPAIGTLANVDYFNLDFRTADEGVWFSACTDGYFVYDLTTPTYTEVGTNLVKSGVDEEVQSWYWVVDFPNGTTGDGVADVYLKDSTHTSWTLVGNDVPCSNDQAGPNGYCYLVQSGYANNDRISHVYSVRLATGLHIPTTSVTVGTTTTQAVTAIGEDNATGHGTIVSTGGEAPSKRGICWATHPYPTVADSYAEDTGTFGTGAFSKLMEDLASATTYYVRAYQYNSAGYSYGNQVTYDTTGDPPAGCTYWVDTAGDDVHGVGSEIDPFQTITHAISVSTLGETICVNDGTYAESQMVLPVGVNLKGTDDNASTVIIQPASNLAYNVPFMLLSSATPGSDGNNTVSYVTLDGDATYSANWAIKVQNRNNVRIHHCNIHDFTGETDAHALWVKSTEIAGTVNWWEFCPTDQEEPGDDSNIDALWPANPVTDFEFDNNIVTNCGYRASLDSGSWWSTIELFNLKDSSIHDNDIDSIDAKAECITGITGLLDNVDIYNNTLRMARYTDRSSYIIEMWNMKGGCEIYNNDANSPFSICIGKETEVHDNVIVCDAGGRSPGLGIEFTLQTYGEVYNNYVENSGHGVCTGVTASQNNKLQENTYIYNNIIYNAEHAPIRISGLGTGGTTDGIKVFNNTINTSDTALVGYGGIRVEQSSTAVLTNVEVINNICTNVGTHAGVTVGTVSNLTIDHNLFFDCGTDDWYGSTDTNSVTTTPDFVATGDKPAYFKLDSASNADDAGTSDVSAVVTDDYWGTARPVNGVYDIGAHEYEAP